MTTPEGDFSGAKAALFCGPGLLCRGHEITHGVGINVSVDGMIRKVNSFGVGLTKVFATIVR